MGFVSFSILSFQDTLNKLDGEVSGDYCGVNKKCCGKEIMGMKSEIEGLRTEISTMKAAIETLIAEVRVLRKESKEEKLSSVCPASVGETEVPVNGASNDKVVAKELRGGKNLGTSYQSVFGVCKDENNRMSVPIVWAESLAGLGTTSNSVVRC